MKYIAGGVQANSDRIVQGAASQIRNRGETPAFLMGAALFKLSLLIQGVTKSSVANTTDHHLLWSRSLIGTYSSLCSVEGWSKADVHVKW